MIRVPAQGRCFLLLAVVIISHLLIKISIAQDEILNDVSVQVGNNITLKCTSSRKLAWWSFNGKNLTSKDDRYLGAAVPFSESREFIDTREQWKFSHNLTIRKVQYNDEGNFTCHKFPNFDVNVIESEISYFIQPYMLPQIVGFNEKKRIYIKAGKPITMYCVIEAYPIDLYSNRVKWYKKDMDSSIDLSDRSDSLKLNDTHLNATLYIDNAVRSSNGTYECSVSSPYTTDLKSMELFLFVLDKPQVSIDYMKAVGSKQIFFNWTVNDGNDPIQDYYIQYANKNMSGFTYYQKKLDVRNTSEVLDGFKPNTEYKIKITAVNNVGPSAAYTYPHYVRTLEKDPIFIPKVRITGSTHSTMSIAWDPPPFDLVEYIQYYDVCSEEEHTGATQAAFHPQNSRNLPYMFDNFKAATMYNVKVRACNELTKACGNWSEAVNGTTMDGVASEPINLKVVCSHYNISRQNRVNVTWESPKVSNGKIVYYHVVLEGIATYRSENGKIVNQTWGPQNKSIKDEKLMALYDNLKPNTIYTARVAGITRQKKMGLHANASCSMPVTVPDNIPLPSWGKIKVSAGKFAFKLYVPRINQRNGLICCYRIYLVRLTDYNRDLHAPEDLEISTYSEVHAANNTKGGAYLVDMFPGNDFHSEVFLGDGRRIYANYGNQSQVDAICRKCFDKNQFRKKPKKIIRVTTTTTTSKPGVQIMPEISQREQLTKAGNLTHAAAKILENKRRRREQETYDLLLKQTIVETTTEDSSLAVPEIVDGEIDMSSNYTGFLEIIVRSNNVGDEGKIFHAYSGYFEKISPGALADNLESNDDMSFILNIVVQVLCALILLVLVLLTALCLMHRYYSKHSVQGEEVISLRDSLSRALCGGRTSNHRHLIGSALAKPADIGPIARNDLPQAYVNRHKDTDYGFLREYEMLPNRFNDRTTKNSEAKENAHKNRYPDIKAYDQTRVKLSMINSIQGSDYINANFVIGYKERKKFICAQGPMDNTIVDFWRMIWEQHLEIIVMLTNLEEYNKAKCAKYWPEKISDSKQFGDITVTFSSEQRYSDYLVRSLDIFRRNGNGDEEEEQRQITQYHYLVWKDFMAPEHPHGIIKFIRQINAVYSVQRGPILIHCSAGVGRTGTLVALDSLLQQLEEEGQVSIFNTVCDLRHQRNFLVQSLKQYIFLYRALLDIAQFGNTELYARDLSATVDILKLKPNDSKEKCRLELQFEKLKSIMEETNKSCSVGSGEENWSKNRSELVIPYDRNRVILTPIPSREHSTYINASFIEGYDNSESFIITQDPLENTVGDFWRMISEQGITTLVMLSEIGDGPRKCPRYWADDEIQYDHILVKYMHSESCPYYTRREFNVTNCKIDDTIKVTQFQYNGWPTVDGEVPEVCRGIIELVDQAQKHHNLENNFSTPSPFAVHCSIGTDRSSIFVAMCILVQQLRTERKVDICTTTRKLRSQRTMLLDTYAQYEFLHRAIVCYADLHKLSLESPTDP